MVCLNLLSHEDEDHEPHQCVKVLGCINELSIAVRTYKLTSQFIEQTVVPIFVSIL